MRPMQEILVSLTLAALLMSGCVKPPTEQVDAAEKAVKEAQQGGAATYAAEEYAKLEASLAAVRKEIADQDAKFALFRDYGKAEQLAASVKADGERVKTEAATKKEEAKAAALQARGQHQRQQNRNERGRCRRGDHHAVIEEHLRIAHRDALAVPGMDSGDGDQRRRHHHREQNQRPDQRAEQAPNRRHGFGRRERDVRPWLLQTHRWLQCWTSSNPTRIPS